MAARPTCFEEVMKANSVRNNNDAHRFEMNTPAGIAVADYRIDGDVMTMFHTEVPLSLRGRGYGYHLVSGALEQVRRLQLKVRPTCWFVREVIDRRPEFQSLLA
jgi:uncharacterized protein